MSTPSGNLYEFGAFRLEPAERLLLRDGAPVPLPPKAFTILVVLVERCGRVVGKEDLMRVAWPETFVEENNLTQCIFVLRRVLGENEDGHSLIETVPKLGYRFLGPLRQPLAGSGENGSTGLHRSPTGVVTQPERQNGNETRTETVSPTPSPVLVTQAARQQMVLAVPWKKKAMYLAAAVLVLGAAMASYRWVLGPAPPRVLDYIPISKNLTLADDLFTDGVHLYFQASVPGGVQLAEMSIIGGDDALLSRLPSEPRLEVLDVAQVSGEILAMKADTGTVERELWILPLPAGSPRPVGGLKGHSGSWSPDGKQIIFANENSLYTARPDGSSVRELVRLPAMAHHPLWSPDGKWIRFILAEANSSSLCEIAADGSHFRSLVRDQMWSGRWTSDGRYYLFSMARNGHYDLWALPESSTFLGAFNPKPIRLTTGPLDLVRPVPSRDGTRIFAIGTLHRVEILRHDPGTKSLVPFLPGVSADSLAFSADGQWVAYSTIPERSLWRSRIDGSERLQLTFPPLQALLPRWSPDGKTIAFAANSAGKPWKIYGIPAQGGLPQPLIQDGGPQASPAWSPDGNFLAFAGAPWETGFAAGSTSVRCLDLRTRQLSVLPGSQDLWSPRWSPDGRYIVAETLDSQELKLFDIRLRQWRSLVRVSNAIVGYTAWSQDSSFVYFNTYGEKSSAVYRAAVGGKNNADLVLDLSNMTHVETLGQWFTLDPNGLPLLLQDTSNRRIYALDVQYR